MKRILFFLWAVLSSSLLSAQTAEMFQPYVETDLRLPSVPIVVNDPYFSIWSPFDTLNEGDTRHWTHQEKPLEGLLRVDGVTYRFMGAPDADIRQAQQLSVSVLATNTYYTFSCGPVELDVVFTAPMLIDDLDLLSTPVNYISYGVRVRDGKAHEVQFYLSASPLMGVNKPEQPTISAVVEQQGVEYLSTGTINQPILATKGDGVCIDWGYFYLSGMNGVLSLNEEHTILEDFCTTGKLPASQKRMVCREATKMPALAYVHDFGQVSEGSSFALVGYDEVLDIEYMYHRYKGYWARNGKSIFTAFSELTRNYTAIMNRCRALDKRIYDDGLQAGGKKYAEILSGSYRHVIAAHKLFQDKDGNLLFFSKENNSNGCVNTVDHCQLLYTCPLKGTGGCYHLYSRVQEEHS